MPNIQGQRARCACPGQCVQELASRGSPARVLVFTELPWKLGSGHGGSVYTMEFSPLETRVPLPPQERDLLVKQPAHIAYGGPITHRADCSARSDQWEPFPGEWRYLQLGAPCSLAPRGWCLAALARVRVPAVLWPLALWGIGCLLAFCA